MYMSIDVIKDKKAHTRRLSSGKKIRVKPHKQRYHLTSQQQRFVDKTKFNLAKVKNSIKDSRQNKRLFIARHRAAQQIMALRGQDHANNFYQDMKEDNAPVGFLADDLRWENWINSLGKDGDLVNIDSSNVLKGYTIPEPWWYWTRTSKRWKRFSRGALKDARALRPQSNYDIQELRLGTKIESEHTDDPVIAEIIAKDHLDEHLDYYYHLVKLEKRIELRNPELRDFRSNLNFR